MSKTRAFGIMMNPCFVTRHNTRYKNIVFVILRSYIIIVQCKFSNFFSIFFFFLHVPIRHLFWNTFGAKNFNYDLHRVFFAISSIFTRFRYLKRKLTRTNVARIVKIRKNSLVVNTRFW